MISSCMDRNTAVSSIVGLRDGLPEQASTRPWRRYVMSENHGEGAGCGRGKGVAREGGGVEAGVAI